VNPVPGKSDKDDVDHKDDGGEEGGEEGEDHGNSAEGPGNDTTAGYDEGENQGEEGKRTCYWMNDECGGEGFGDDVGSVGVDVEELEEGGLKAIAYVRGAALARFIVAEAFDVCIDSAHAVAPKPKVNEGVHLGIE